MASLRRHVGPARAGMIRVGLEHEVLIESWPRTRGDDPASDGPKAKPTGLAPHARG